MDYILRKTKPGYLPSFGSIWSYSSNAASGSEEASSKSVGEGTLREAATTTQLQNTKLDQQPTGFTGVPLASIPSESIIAANLEEAASDYRPTAIIRKSSNARKATRRSTTIAPNKVFLVVSNNKSRSGSVRRKDVKITVLDVTTHLSDVSVDREPLFKLLNDKIDNIPNNDDWQDDGYLFCRNSFSAFTLRSLASLSPVAIFSLPLHPLKVIAVSFPSTKRSSRPRPHSRTSSFSGTSIGSASSQQPRPTAGPALPKMVTLSSVDKRSNAFIHNGSVYMWETNSTGKILRRQDSTDTSLKRGEGALCARYCLAKRKGEAILILDTNRCNERVTVSTLLVCLRREEGLRGFLINIFQR